MALVRVSTKVPAPENPELVAQNLGLALEQMDASFAVLLEYIGLQVSLSRKREIDSEVNEFSITLLGDSKERRTDRQKVRTILRENKYTQLNIVSWSPNAVERGNFVQPLYKALGSPLPNSTIVLTKDLVRNVMVVLHSLAVRRLQELGMKTLPLHLKIRVKNRDRLQTEWVERLIKVFGCSVDMKYFDTGRKRQKYRR